MTVTIHHINCGTLRVAGYPTVVCHCLAIADDHAPDVCLIDTGIGLADCRDPDGRLGRELIAAAGFQLNPRDTAHARLAALGIDPARVTDIVLTHADPDHTGGLADFPSANIHIARAELDAVRTGHPRYTHPHFAHGPNWRAHAEASQNASDWFGLPAHRVPLALPAEVLLIPLPGHTLGHRGVAVRTAPGRWLLHAGDAYYLRAELTDEHHPVSAMAAARAEDDAARRASLAHLRRLAADHADTVAMFGYHDITELPPECIDWDD